MKGSGAALFAALAIFIAGILAVIQVRFETGDVYPPLSTFRSDPLGSRVLYESLRSLPGVNVQRSIDADLKPSYGAFVLLGIRIWDVTARIERLAPLLAAGGRVIVVLLPETSGPNNGATDLGKKIGAKFRFGPKLTAKRDGVPKDTIVWMSELDPAWKVIKSGEHGPVAAERALDQGSLVIATESYPFSNEALALDRDAPLVASVMGDLPSITFDESHHGIRETPGVALLVRKYRLHAIVAAFAATALLFIWSVAIPFAAPTGELPASVVASDASRSFARLLERHIPLRDVLSVSIEEWRKTAGQEETRFNEVQAIAQSSRDPVGAYQAIKAALDSTRNRRSS